MKLLIKYVCIKNIDEKYLKIGKIYDGYIDDTICRIKINEKDDQCFIEGITWCKSLVDKYFITLAEYREQQINEILNEDI